MSKNQTIDISAIVVNWNAKQLLLECLESIMKETIKHSLEIIVVDNASSDGSSEAVESRFPKVCVIRNEANLGFARANNLGIRRSRGKYICLLNSDVKLLDACLDRMCDFMQNNPGIGVLGSKLLKSDLTTDPACREFPSFRNALSQALLLNRIFPSIAAFRGREMTRFDHNSVRSVAVLPGCSLMIRREALEEVGLLDETFFMYGEDVDWCKRFHNGKWDVVFYPEAKLIHYGAASSSQQPLRFLVEMERSSLRYWGKHHSQVSKRLYSAIKMLHYAVRVIGWSICYIVKPSARVNSRVSLRKVMTGLRWLVFQAEERGAK